MRLAILDPAAGISGDMVLGALLDAGAEREWLEGLPQRLGFQGVQVRVQRVSRAALTAMKVDFGIPGDAHHGHDHHGDHHHGRHVGELLEIVERAPISPWVKERALRGFRLLGEAEGRVHGVAPERVHLHEVGAVDAVLDIVGGIEGFERLGIDRIYNLPVALGHGWVEASHGKLPVPAPATTLLLEGTEVTGAGPVEGEATTPTGATLLRVLSEGPPPPRWRIQATGWGAGERNPAGYANALRLIIAESADEAGVVEIIATDIDDLQPEYIEPLREAIFAAGALDCVMWSTHGKKGRMGVRVEALAPPGTIQPVVDALFANSTTAGVRRWSTTRATLARRQLTVELAPGIVVRTKVWDGLGTERLKPEYNDVISAASALGLPPLEVARRVQRAAELMLDGSRRVDNPEPE